MNEHPDTIARREAAEKKRRSDEKLAARVKERLEEKARERKSEVCYCSTPKLASPNQIATGVFPKDRCRNCGRLLPGHGPVRVVTPEVREELANSMRRRFALAALRAWKPHSRERVSLEPEHLTTCAPCRQRWRLVDAA